MKMKKGLLMTALITGTVMSSAVAFAEELQEYSLGQMVVTATRTEKKDLDIPAVVEVYSAKFGQVVEVGFAFQVEQLFLVFLDLFLLEQQMIQMVHHQLYQF